jgi:hypothetical protein
MKKVFARIGYTLQDIGSPDLCATKNDEVVLVEVMITNITTPQLEHYQKVGKVVLIFDFCRNKNFEVWGWNYLS